MKRLGNILKLVALSYQFPHPESDMDQLGIFSSNHYFHEGEQRNWHWEDVASRIVLAVPIATNMCDEKLESKYKPATYSIQPDYSVERNVIYTDEEVVWIGSDERHFMTWGTLGYRLWKVLDIIPALRKLEPVVTITEEYPERFQDTEVTN